MNPVLYRRFFQWCHRQGLAEGTIRAYRSIVRRWEAYLEEVDATDLADVTSEVVAGFAAWLMKTPSRFGRRLSTSSRSQTLIWLRRLFFYLLETGQILVDPTRKLRLPRVARRLPRSVLTAEEMRRLLDIPDTRTAMGLRDRAMIELLYGTGLRFSEMADLAVGQVDIEDRVVWVRQGKGRRDRVVPLGRWAAHWLARHIKISADHRRRFRSERVFLTVRGLRVHDFMINQVLREYARAARITKHITVHALRHTCATVLIKGGADVRQIQKLLGHASLSTTAVYTHLDLEDLRRVQIKCHPRERLSRTRRP